MNDAMELTRAYYRAAGRSEADIMRDAAAQDVAVLSKPLVLMARRVKRCAPLGRIIDLARRFNPQECDAWHLHFIAGDIKMLLAWKKEICSLPWILTQHGKRGDGRLVCLSTQRFCRALERKVKAGASARF